MSAAKQRALTSWTVLRLLVRFRARHAWNGFRRGGASGSRWVGLVALVLPLTYVGLFVSAFTIVAQIASWPVQVATVAVVVCGLSVASLVSKLTGGDAVVAGTGENEFFMSRPLGLASLVVARAFASAVLDVWGALFLVPVLSAAAIVWGLGPAGVLVALVSSVVVQVLLVALGQTVALSLLGRVSLARRRTLATAFGLLSALSVALLWAVASFVLRQPHRFVAAVQPWAGSLVRSPLAFVVRPLVALRERGLWSASLWLGALTVIALAVVWAASRVAQAAARRGWENAGLPFETAGPAQQRTGAALSIAGKELRQLLRDRARFVALLAMPFLFVGVQVFGAAGMAIFGGGPQRAGLLAYSLAAYLATLGPLPHMQGERRAFWILRSVPVPLGRIMWGKVKAWLWIIVGVAVVAFVATVAVGGEVSLHDPTLWTTLLLVVAGSALVCALAVGVGCNVADLSDEGRNAMGPAGVYVFLMVAGLFNLALLRSGELAWRTVGLYTGAVALVWVSGVRRAETALDPGRLRPLTPGDGVLAALLLFCGVHLIALGPAGLSASEAQAGALVWAALVSVATLAFLLSVRRGLRRKGAAVWSLWSAWRGKGLLRTVAATLAVSAGFWGLRLVLPLVPNPLVMVLAEELVFRGLLQRSLTQHFEGRHRAWALSAAVSLAVATLASTGPLSLTTVVVQGLCVLSFAGAGTIAPAVLGRMLLFVF